MTESIQDQSGLLKTLYKRHNETTGYADVSSAKCTCFVETLHATSLFKKRTGRPRTQYYVIASLRSNPEKIKLLGLSILFFFLFACSTTKNLPAGETLYAGIEKVVITDADSVKVSNEMLDRIEEALAFPPNNALLGSSSTRLPFPFGLWVYNAYINKKGVFSRWIMNSFAAKPILMSQVRPQRRIEIVKRLLRDNGYFDSETSYEVVVHKNDSTKAKIRYDVTLNKPYTLDSIEWRRIQDRADTLLQLNEAERLLRKGDIFSVEKLEAERQRLASIMRDKGYYFFRPEYIVYRADSTIAPYQVSLIASLKQGSPRSILHPWSIGQITVQLSGYDNETPTDSIRYKDMMVYYEGKLRVRPKVLYDQLKFGRGDLYSLKKQTETQTALNRLDIFRFTDFQYTPQDTSATCDTMNIRINAMYDYPLNGVFEVKATVNDNQYAGPDLSLNLIRRNIFGGGEVMTTSVYGQYEWNTGKQTIQHTGFINNYELGVQSNILFPRLVLPKIGKRAYDFSATSLLDFDVNLLNRAGYFSTLRAGGALSYEFLPNPIRLHRFTPFKLVFNKLQRTTAAFDSIANLNPSLRQSLQDQFIPSIGYSYTLDNTQRRKYKSKTWWQFTVSEAGNIISAAYRVYGKKFNEEKQILGSPYAQFFKVTTELRRNLYIDRNQCVVFRIGGGAIFSYGNAKIAPYNERFYVGGANSIRAFTIRSIGPGRFRPDASNPYAYIDQNGDLMVEANVEYRGRLVGDLDIAIFFDAGNVWLMRKDETRPGGTLRLKNLPEDIAFGTGIGFRYDMSMLVFRVDIGYALHYPYDTRKQNPAITGDPEYIGRKKYFNTPSFGDGLGFHIALGYPF